MLNSVATTFFGQVMSKYRRPIVFGLIGCLNTIVDIGFFLLFYKLLSLHLILANTLSFIIACTNSFFWNRNITFGDLQIGKSVGISSFFLFFIVSIIALGISNVIVYVVSLFTYPLIGKFISVISSLVVNYLGVRFFVFRDRR